MRARAAAVPLAAVVLLGACRDDLVAPKTFEDARVRWNAQRISDYVYTLQILCFCGEEMTTPVAVRVTGGTVASRTYQGTGVPVDPAIADRFPTIDSLFGVVRYAYQTAASVNVTYDPTYGFPTLLQVAWIANAVDDENTYTARDFRTLR